MLHIVDAAQARASDALLRTMFAARKRVFVDLLKWRVPVIDGRYEIDQFDDEHATYLLLADAEGGHLGSARLLPTTRPHILGDLFPALCDGDAPRGDDTWEITRFCLDRSLRASERRRIRDTLVTALAEHALSKGIAHYTAIAAVGWIAQILSFGWSSRPLGLPRLVGSELLSALIIDIDETTPARLRRAGLMPIEQVVAAPGLEFA